MKKASSFANKVAFQINQERRIDYSGISPVSSSDEDSFSGQTGTCNWKQLCQNGKCTWKLKEKYDDINAEIREADEAN